MLMAVMIYRRDYLRLPGLALSRSLGLAAALSQHRIHLHTGTCRSANEIILFDKVQYPMQHNKVHCVHIVAPLMQEFGVEIMKSVWS